MERRAEYQDDKDLDEKFAKSQPGEVVLTILTVLSLTCLILLFINSYLIVKKDKLKYSKVPAIKEDHQKN